MNKKGKEIDFNHRKEKKKKGGEEIAIWLGITPYLFFLISLGVFFIVEFVTNPDIFSTKFWHFLVNFAIGYQTEKSFGHNLLDFYLL